MRLVHEANTNTLFDSGGAAVDGQEGWLSAPALRTCGPAWPDGSSS